MNEFELIIAIVQKDYSGMVMEAARRAGASGGTILNARGSGGDIEKLFGLMIQPEKEIVLIITEKVMKEGIMKEIIADVGLNTNGKGICFSLPVDDVLGAAFKKETEKEEEDPS